MKRPLNLKVTQSLYTIVEEKSNYNLLVDLKRYLRRGKFNTRSSTPSNPNIGVKKWERRRCGNGTKYPRFPWKEWELKPKSTHRNWWFYSVFTVTQPFRTQKTPESETCEEGHKDVAALRLLGRRDPSLTYGTSRVNGDVLGRIIWDTYIPELTDSNLRWLKTTPYSVLLLICYGYSNTWINKNEVCVGKFLRRLHMLYLTVA